MRRALWLLLLLLAAPVSAQECPGRVAFANLDGADLDIGWGGYAHDQGIVSNSALTLTVDSCAGGTTPPCGVCTLSGPITNAGAGQTTIENQRCLVDTSVHCTNDADCPSGVCAFFFGGPLPVAAGGVGSCLLNEFTAALTGTLDVEAGEAEFQVDLVTNVWLGPTPQLPCPRCLGDSTANDADHGGTCDSGARSGLSCDTNGVHPTYGGMSLDCVPAGSASARVPMSTTFGTSTKTLTLSASSPNCSAFGHSSQKCWCAVCGQLDFAPCATDADCDPGKVCGGPVCLPPATNAGDACTPGPGSGCTGPCAPNCPCASSGQPTAPNPCTGGTCTATTGNSGECNPGGPFEGFCQPLEPWRGCLLDADCPAPGDSCVYEAWKCFVGDGTSGDAITSPGDGNAPVGATATVDLAAVWCVAPTVPALDSVAGLPGPARMLLPGTITGLAPASATRRVVIAGMMEDPR